MAKRMLIDALHPEEVRVAIADNSQIFEFDFATIAKKQLKGNIYLAKITRVEPSLQAAFVEYGGGKQGFLPFSEIHPDYYQIPISDRKRLMEEVEREQALLDAEDESGPAEENGMTEATLAAADEPLEEGSEYTASEYEPSEVPLEFAIPQSGFPAAIEETVEVASEIQPEEPAAPPAMAESVVHEVAVSEVVVPTEEKVAEEAKALASEENTEAPKEEASAEALETIVSEEEERRPKRVQFFKRYRIQEVIKRGQVVLVQVIKEERGNKGVSLTTYLSLAGRYCVLMPNSPRDGGVSRKISDSETRKRLKSIMSEMKTARGMSVIIRTAGIDRTRAEIKRDFDYLVKLWNRIREDTLAATAPALIYEESDIIKRAIRDQYTSDIEELLIEGDNAYKSAREFMKMLLPSHTPRVKHYRDNTPLFYAYGIEDQLMSMHDPVVKLKSGGYIVLSPTEALISIDVNSGRSTGERNIEETASKTNLEAAYEIARQLRLRDLAGLIVIDFIDMMESKNRRSVERALKDALKSDRAKIQLGRISPFGLLEMSRQRLRPSIAEASTVQCPHCVGRGVVRSNESLSIQMIRALEKEASNGQWQVIKLLAPEHAALHLLNHKRNLLATIEERYGVQIVVEVSREQLPSIFTLDKTRRAHGNRGENGRGEGQEGRRFRGNRNERPDRNRNNNVEEPAQEQEAAISEEEEVVVADSNAREDRPRRDRTRRRRNRRGGNRDTEFTPNTNEEGAEEVIAQEAGAEVEAEEAPRGNRGARGRGRGRRRWKDEGENAAPATEGTTDNAQSYSENPAREQAYAPAPQEPKQQPVLAVTHHFARDPDQNMPQPTRITELPATQRPEGAPARKGWWQRMIELE